MIAVVLLFWLSLGALVWTHVAYPAFAAGLVEFWEAFLPWWGGGHPETAMSGTFYWWNPFAAFLLPGALLGAALAIAGRQTWRTLGWLAAPMCAAGIVFSSSRMRLKGVVKPEAAPPGPRGWG